jgi:hypothetical protein
MNIEEACSTAPIGLSEHRIFRSGVVRSYTITWVRYTPRLNSKRGRFGIRKVSRKVCSITHQLD